MEHRGTEHPEEQALGGQASETNKAATEPDDASLCSRPETSLKSESEQHKTLHKPKYSDEEHQDMWRAAAPAPAPTPIRTNEKLVEQKPATVIARTTKTPPLPSSIEYHSDLIEMRVRRKRRTIMYGVVSGVAGLLFLGPFGLVFGVAAAAGTDRISRRNEQKKLEELQPAIDLKAESVRMKRAEAIMKDAVTPNHST